MTISIRLQYKEQTMKYKNHLTIWLESKSHRLHNKCYFGMKLWLSQKAKVIHQQSYIAYAYTYKKSGIIVYLYFHTGAVPTFTLLRQSLMNNVQTANGWKQDYHNLPICELKIILQIYKWSDWSFADFNAECNLEKGYTSTTCWKFIGSLQSIVFFL